MAAHPYSLRTRLNTPKSSPRSISAHSPYPRPRSQSPKKTKDATSLSLRRIIGTTTVDNSGLSSHASSDTFAYCAGSVAVIARFTEGHIVQRFYKARPLASAINPSCPVYNERTTTRRSSLTPARLNGYSTPTASPVQPRREQEITPTWTARERIKAVTCVSLSHDGMLLAVGEAGYNPRVLIFSTADDGPTDVPLSAMAEHSFGVRAVCFSPDSSYLATLGEANDGFLFIWSIHPRTGAAKLHSTNKCKSDIRGMTWLGNNLVTVGTRHIKLWRVAELPKSSPNKARLRSQPETPSSPAPTALAGRNVLLGPLIECTFPDVVAVSDKECIVITEQGHVCILDDAGGAQELRLVRCFPYGLTSVSYRTTTGQICLSTDTGTVNVEQLDVLRYSARPMRKASLETRYATSKSEQLDRSGTEKAHKRPTTGTVPRIALKCLSENLLSVDTNRNFEILSVSDAGLVSKRHELVAHRHPIAGLRLMPPGHSMGAFYTWTAAGDISFWKLDGSLQSTQHIESGQSAEEEGFSNDLTVVHFVADAGYFVSGDQVGVLTVSEQGSWVTLQQSRAHGAQVNDIVSRTVGGVRLAVSCGRDRTVQLFRATSNTLELLQTMDDHIGAVTQVLFASDGERLLSSSSDRTVIVRDRISRDCDVGETSAFLTLRVVTLKANPISMALLPGDANTLVVSAMDRHIITVNVLTGATVDSFKVSDPDSDDTVCLHDVTMTAMDCDACPRLLVGCSSNDKSIRVYDLQKNVLLTREAGHTEGISDLALLERKDEVGGTVQRTVISTGLDGTVMTWDLKHQAPLSMATPLGDISQGQTLRVKTPRNISPASLPPLRKVLSQLDLAGLVRVDPVSGSPVRVRDLSPGRLRKKPSRLSMAANKIPEHGIPQMPPSQTSFQGITVSNRIDSRSPPSGNALDGPQKARHQTHPQRSPSEQRSPSIPINCVSTPNTPHHLNRPNNGRLRRPPSVPTDLRTQVAQHTRRKSVGNMNMHDFGSVEMDTDQACRMLRSYRKRLQHMQADIHIRQVEEELLDTLEVVRKRAAEPSAARRVPQETQTASPSHGGDMGQLSAMLEGVVMTDAEPVMQDTEQTAWPP